MAAIYRAEVIGSMLRPGWLKQARTDFAADRISTAQFKRVEDRAVDEAIALQERCGVDVVSDGEMRRSGFVAPLTTMSKVSRRSRLTRGDGRGARRERRNRRNQFGGAAHRDRQAPAPALAGGRGIHLRARPRATSAEGGAAESADARDALVAGTFGGGLSASRSRFSPTPVDILRAEVAELASLGCEYVQIDAPELATLVDPSTRERVFEAHGISTARMLGEGVEMLNALADVSGVTFGLHLCRGNNAGHWLSTGGYEAISREVFARATRFDIFLLEYDSPRAGSFAPLADVAGDKRVALGLVSTKSDELEMPDALIARIDEAARHFPREQMALSTQCGFASVLAGNPIAEATQEKKLRLVAEVAHRVWN